MNPLTQIKNTQRVTKAEIELGLTDKASWHDRFKHSAYVFAGGLPFELTEGDLLAVFAQYGEVVDVHLVRDKKTGKSKGFAFLAYEDQRSTVLVVDNLSGAKVAGRVIRVEHVDNYKRKRAEMEGEPVPGSDEEDEEAGQEAAQQQQGVQEDGGGGAANGGGNEPWGGGNSVFSLLNEGPAQKKIKTWAEIQAEAAQRKREREAAEEAAAAGGPPGLPALPRQGRAQQEAGAGRSKKEKKEKKKQKKDKKRKEKKEKKQKRKEGAAGSSSSEESSEEEGEARPQQPAAGDDRRQQQAQQQQAAPLPEGPGRGRLVGGQYDPPVPPAGGHEPGRDGRRERERSPRREQQRARSRSLPLRSSRPHDGGSRDGGRRDRSRSRSAGRDRRREERQSRSPGRRGNQRHSRSRSPPRRR